MPSQGFLSVDLSSSRDRWSAHTGGGRCAQQFDPFRRASRKGMCARRRADQGRGGGLRVAAVPTLTNSRSGMMLVLMIRTRGRGAARMPPICLDHWLAGFGPGQPFLRGRA